MSLECQTMNNSSLCVISLASLSHWQQLPATGGYWYHTRANSVSKLKGCCMSFSAFALIKNKPSIVRIAED